MGAYDSACCSGNESTVRNVNICIYIEQKRYIYVYTDAGKLHLCITVQESPR